MPKEEKVKKKKKHIIEALKRCLERNPYPNVAIHDVADESDFSKGGLMHYYPTKEDLYIDLMEDMFSEIEKGHEFLLKDDLKTEERANLSALYEIETFFMDKKTVKIFLNLLLYSLEDDKIRQYVKKFSRNQLNLYENMIRDSQKQFEHKRKTDSDPKSIARIIQTVVLATGILEAVDEVKIDPNHLTKFIITMLKG